MREKRNVSSAALIRFFLFDPDEKVFASLLINQRLREEELLLFAGSDGASAEKLLILSSDPKWSNRYAVRKALAERHLAAKQPDQAEKWAMECLYVNVYDPAAHIFLADALSDQKKFAPAIEEYQTAIGLKAKRPNDLKVRLAKAQLGLGNRDAAKATLDALLKDDPDHPEAKELRKEIGD